MITANAGSSTCPQCIVGFPDGVVYPRKAFEATTVPRYLPADIVGAKGVYSGVVSCPMCGQLWHISVQPMFSKAIIPVNVTTTRL